MVEVNVSRANGLEGPAKILEAVKTLSPAEMQQLREALGLSVAEANTATQPSLTAPEAIDRAKAALIRMGIRNIEVREAVFDGKEWLIDAVSTRSEQWHDTSFRETSRRKSWGHCGYNVWADVMRTDILKSFETPIRVLLDENGNNPKVTKEPEVATGQTNVKGPYCTGNQQIQGSWGTDFGGMKRS